ncbi:MAG: hypothetical protein ACXACR_02270, partial [Candidatus Hodarchaeales archaeon]
MKKTESNELKEKILLALGNRQHSSLRGVAAETGFSSTWLRKQILLMRRKGDISAWQLILNPWS